MNALTDEQREDLKHKLVGTTDRVETILEKMGLDVNEDDAEAQLLDGPEGVELCDGCEWWHWSYQLNFDCKTQKSYCDSCSPTTEDD